MERNSNDIFFLQIKVIIFKCIKYQCYTYEKGHANAKICPKVSTLDHQLLVVSRALTVALFLSMWLFWRAKIFNTKSNKKLQTIEKNKDKKLHKLNMNFYVFGV
jgi:uncharacterized protein (UPF0212 family)